MTHPKLLFTVLPHDSQRLLLEILGPDGAWQIPIDKVQAGNLGNQLIELSKEQNTEGASLEQFLDELMISLPAGKLWMGSMPAEKIPEEELPRHPVNLSKNFAVSALPITQGFYRLIMGENPSVDKGSKKPVESVSWFDSVAFCNALSKLQGLEEAYRIEAQKVTWNQEANGFRLLTEAEWEYAARTKDDLHYSGNDHLDRVGWYSENCTELQEVGKKSPNDWGFYDMSGGVFEWCWDWNTSYKNGELSDPTGPAIGFERICRGGSWSKEEWFARTTCRYAELPEMRHHSIGFRIAKNL